MVTNAVNARLAWSYGLDAELRIMENSQAMRCNLKIMETMYEAYIGAMAMAAETESDYYQVLSAFMAQLFTKDVFPDLVALQCVTNQRAF